LVIKFRANNIPIFDVREGRAAASGPIRVSSVFLGASGSWDEAAVARGSSLPLRLAAAIKGASHHWRQRVQFFISRPRRNPLLDHVVGAHQQRWWHAETESLRRFEVEGRLILDWPLHREVSGMTRCIAGRSAWRSCAMDNQVGALGPNAGDVRSISVFGKNRAWGRTRLRTTDPRDVTGWSMVGGGEGLTARVGRAAGPQAAAVSHRAEIGPVRG
jgi:hypothetical protein